MSDERTDARLPDVWVSGEDIAQCRETLDAVSEEYTGWSHQHHYIPAARVQRMIDEHNADTRPNWGKAKSIEDVVMHHKEAVIVLNEELSAVNAKVAGLVEALEQIDRWGSEQVPTNRTTHSMWHAARQALAAFREGRE